MQSVFKRTQKFYRLSAKHHPMCLDQARILLAPPLLPGTTMNLGPIFPLLLPFMSRFKGRGEYLQLVVGGPLLLLQCMN